METIFSYLVSIIIPAFNAEQYIADTIQSVLNQTYSNWELIVINDGSTDDTELVCQSFTDARIKYIHQTNRGVSKARNRGIEESNGSFIAFLDADDVWKRDNLKERLFLFKQYPEVDWVYGNLELIDEKGNSTGAFICGDDSNSLRSALAWTGEVITTPSTIIGRGVCVKKIKFDPTFTTAADQDFVFNLAATYKGKLLNKPLVQYRVLANSMSRNIRTMEKDHIGVYQKAAENGLFSSWLFKQQCFSRLYLILAGSWWKEGNNKPRAILFLIKSIVTYPPQVLTLFSKIL